MIFLQLVYFLLEDLCILTDFLFEASYIIDILPPEMLNLDHQTVPIVEFSNIL